MNFGTLNRENITLHSDGRKSSMTVSTPISLLENLKVKRMAVKQMTIDIKSFPQFIPELSITDELLNYNAGAIATNLSIGQPTGNFDSIVLGAYLGYFVTVRDLNGLRSATVYVQYLNPNNIPVIVPPLNMMNAPVKDIMNYLNQQRYYNPYYFMYNYLDFLQYVASAIDKGYNALNVGAELTAGQKTYCTYDQANKTYSLSVSAQLSNYVVEFSSSLHNLLKFNAQLINNTGTFFKTDNPGVKYFSNVYRLIFNPLQVYIDNNLYLNVSAKVINNIFPFDTFILECPTLPLNQMYFRSSKDILQSFSMRFNAVKVWKKKINILEMDQNLYDETLDAPDDAVGFTGNQQISSFLEFKLFAKSKEGNYLEWTFPEGEAIEFILNIYNVY